ncbi:hypothetical protein NIES4103_31680 [Nostoc sp. NIES-4103]|nr:hypothetical protein NIES4103_31680 [Nostoc sp. NIES-4103]
MHQYSSYLLLLVIAVISAFSVNPCQAQTLPDSNSDKAKIIPVSPEVSTTEDTTKLSQVRDSVISNNQETILSETTTSDAPLASTKSNLRIPISSRIFAGPSMQQ